MILLKVYMCKELSLPFERFFNSARLNDLLAQQPRNKKSKRCMSHSLGTQRIGLSPNAWKEAWECMDKSCQEELTLIENDVLDKMLNVYLRKNRYNFILQGISRLPITTFNQISNIFYKYFVKSDFVTDFVASAATRYYEHPLS